MGATRNSDFESSSHLVIIVFCFELSHLVIELLVCYLCIIDTLSSLVIMILGNEHNWEF